MNTTADAVLHMLQSFSLKSEGPGKYRCNSPLRPGANSHSFCIKIDDGEHGTWIDQVSGESGSLYDLATQLGIPLPSAKAASATTSKRGYSGLADYAQAHGASEGAYRAWKWEETTKDGRRALKFETLHGDRWRFIDGAKPPFTNVLGYKPCWYGLAEAVALAQITSQPLVLTNGEASVVAAQSYGIPACSITNSGERELPAPLLQQLQGAYTGPILIALDCDDKGRKAAPKLAAQVGGQVVDLQGADGFDLADFCKLWQGGAMAELVGRAQPAFAAPTPAPPYTVSGRIMTALAKLGYSFRLNVLSDDIEVNGQLMTRVMASQIRTAIRDMNVTPLDALEDVIITAAAQNAYHPIQEYLGSLTWDGTPRISQIAALFACTDSPMTYGDGTTRPLFDLYLHRWLIGAVARVYEQGQNLMLVLCGAQGAGKSAFVRWLCSKLLHYYAEAPLVPGERLSDLRVIATFIWEVAELDATTRKSDISSLKAFITRQQVTARKFNEKYDIHKPALASFFGTVNEGSAGFLADETGNRRFMVATITGLDWSYTQFDVDQVWAEAVARYRHGEPWTLSPEESAYQHEVNQAHELADPIDGWLERHFYFDVVGDTVGMTTADIIDHLRSRDVPVNADRTWETRIGAALRKRGIMKKQIRTGLQRDRRYFGLVARP